MLFWPKMFILRLYTSGSLGQLWSPVRNFRTQFVPYLPIVFWIGYIGSIGPAFCPFSGICVILRNFALHE